MKGEGEGRGSGGEWEKEKRRGADKKAKRQEFAPVKTKSACNAAEIVKII